MRVIQNQNRDEYWSPQSWWDKYENETMNRKNIHTKLNLNLYNYINL